MQTPSPAGSEPAAADADAYIGQEPLGQFRILKKLGSGGFGAVYLADQLGVDRKAVIKIVHARLAQHDAFIQRFRREARVLAKLKHPNIVQLYNFGELPGGELFLAMEWGGDRTLGDELERQRRLPVVRALKIAEQICDCLIKAHAEGIVHRDLKPANVLLGSEGDPDRAMVVDLGIAKIVESNAENDSITQTQGGIVIGTPAYFSPEQARGMPLDGRSDLYSLGILLYETLCGVRPIQAASTNDYILAHSVQIPAPPSAHGVKLPHAVEAIVLRALEKKPEKRFQSAAEMKAAIAASRNAAEAPPPRWPKIALYAGVLSAIAAGACALFVFSSARPPPPPPKRAVVKAVEDSPPPQPAPVIEAKVESPPPRRPPRKRKPKIAEPAVHHEAPPTVAAAPPPLIGILRVRAPGSAGADEPDLEVRGSGKSVLRLRGLTVTAAWQPSLSGGVEMLLETEPAAVALVDGRPQGRSPTVSIGAKPVSVLFDLGDGKRKLVFTFSPARAE